MDPELLCKWITDARQRTLELIADLSDAQLRVAHIPIVNPLDWEVGHVAYFQELFALRDVDGRPCKLERAREIYDSIAIEHAVRWDLKLPPRAVLLRYLNDVRDDAIAMVRAGKHDDYRQQLAVFHEDMHGEAITYTRQTMGYPQPNLTVEREDTPEAGALPGDVEVVGGRFRIGALETGFSFDNEHVSHEVDVAPFAIARAPVTQAEFAAFVADGGYLRRQLWSDEGWNDKADATAPMHWRPMAGQGNRWERRNFDQWVALEPHRPVIHVSWYEADAYCRWAERRLPSEIEWEVAAAGVADGKVLGPVRRRYPWGNEVPSPQRVNMDWRAMGCLDVAALPEGDSAFGCRQMLGNVWEWTADTFEGYAGFEPGPYREYSEPLFGTTKVLRGGCWATRSRLLRNSWRNYYEPNRRDVWAGFRTCPR